MKEAKGPRTPGSQVGLKRSSMKWAREEGEVSRARSAGESDRAMAEEWRLFSPKGLSPGGGSGRRSWRGGDFLGSALNLESELQGSSMLGGGVLFGGV